MDYDQFILAARAALHFATFCLLFSYRDPDAQRRPMVSLLAISLAAPSIAMCLHILGNWGGRALTPAQLVEHTLIAILSAAVFVAVALSRGNVAKLLPRRIWSHLP